MIIGSTAIKFWFPDFPREPKDIDIIKDMYIKEYSSHLKIEWLENLVLKNWFTKPIEICTPNELYTLKISHSFWNLNNNSWEKHMWDIQFLKEKGCELIPALFTKLYEYWSEIHGQRKVSNLNMSAEEFFDNAVNYPVNHDYLHTLLIQHPYFKKQKLPTYTKVLKDGAEVDVSESKFNLLTEEEKFNLVIEEVMVMAIERYGKLDFRRAYNKMLKKFILNHAPLWESVWIVQNHKKLSKCPFNYLEFLEQLINKKK